MKRLISTVILIFVMSVVVSAQDIATALRQAQARFDSGNETGGIELVNKVLAKYPDSKEAKDLLAKFNKVIKDREIEADWKIATTTNTFESYEQFRSKHPGSIHDDTASDNMAKRLADKFTQYSSYTDRTRAEAYAKKAMTKDYIANKWKAAMAKKTNTTSSSSSSSNTSSSYSNNSSYGRNYGTSSSTSRNSYGNSSSTYSSKYKKEKLITFGVDLSADFDVLGGAYGVSPGLLMRIGSYEKWINGFVGIKYAHWSGKSDYSWSYDSHSYECKVNALALPVIVNLNYLPGDLLGLCAYFGVGYEFNLAYSGTYVNSCAGSWVLQMGLGGRHWDWRFYYRIFPSPFFNTLEDGTLGTGLTYYF